MVIFNVVSTVLWTKLANLMSFLQVEPHAYFPLYLLFNVYSAIWLERYYVAFAVLLSSVLHIWL